MSRHPRASLLLTTAQPMLLYPRRNSLPPTKNDCGGGSFTALPSINTHSLSWTAQLLMLAVIFAGVPSQWSVAAEVSALAKPTSTQQPQSKQLGKIPFRRIFVPVDSPEAWPVGSERYLPIPRAEFSRLVRQQQPSAVSKKQLPIRVSRAVYRAELLSSDVLQGDAEWTVEITGDPLPEKAARLLPLSPMNLAIQSATWLRDPSETAAVGLWKRDDHGMALAVLARQSGTLRIAWQLAAQRIDTQRVDFTIQTPIVVPQTLELLLPANRSATLSGGELLEASAPGPLGKSRWVFQLAPAEIHRLQIFPVSPTRATRAQPFVSQETSYQLEPSGLTVVTQLRLDARELPIAELKAAVASGLRIVEVRIDQQPVAWRVVDNGGENALIIPRPDSEQPQSVEIRGLAEFRSDITWELPKLRFDEVAWTEGTTSLLVSPRLELRLLTPRQATIQHIVGIADNAPADEPLAGEVFRLQEWSSEAALEIEVGRPLPRLSARSATAIEVGRDEAKATIAASFFSSGRDVYQVQATVAADWSVDSVTTIPKFALNDWHIDRQGKSSMLRFQLNQPISKQRALRFEIKARQTTARSVLPGTVGQLRVLRFQSTDVRRELFNLRTRNSKQIALADRLERGRLARDELTAEFSDLLPEPTTGTLIDVSHLNEAAVVDFRQQEAQYKAHLQIEIDAQPGSFQHHYQIDCRLQSGAVSEIVVGLDEPLPEDLQWSFVGQGGLITSERIETDLPKEAPKTTAAGTLPRRGARYRLQLPVDMTNNFRLQASYSHPTQPLERCNLIRLPQSTDWDGQVVLRGSLEGFRILDQGWTPAIYSDDGVGDEKLPVLGAYRLGPEESLRESTIARLRMQRHPDQPSAPQIIAWLAEYRTLQAANGAAIHLASYSLENLGVGEARIVLPEGTELQEAWLDNQQLEAKQISSEGDVYQFQFGDKLRWPYLALKYSTQAQPLGGSASLQPVVPECSFPVILSRWTLWAPEQYEIDKTQQEESSQRFHLWRRVFGPLARSRGETVFNPVRSDNWAQLWSTPLVNKQTKQAAENLASQLADRLESDGSQTAGDLLSDLVDQNEVADLFFVDRTALLAKGIQAHTLCRELIASNRTSRSLNDLAIPLSSHRLALLVSHGLIVLTTAERVAHWHDQLRPTETSGVFMVSSDDFADSLDTIRSSRSAEIVAIPQWQQSPPVESPRWLSDGAPELADLGRRAQTVEFIEALPTLVVRRAFVERALWYAVLLSTLVLGVWKITHYPNAMILAFAVAGATCLIVPASWLTIPQAFFLGLLAAAVVQVATKSKFIADARLRKTRKVAPAAIAFFWACLAPPLVAQSLIEDGLHEKLKKDLPLVLLPIDSEGSQQGDDIYLSEELLETLQRSSEQVANAGAEQVLLAANYRGSLPSNYGGIGPAADAIRKDPWTLRWKVASYLPNCRFFLPLRRDEAAWDEKAHRLDGVPIQLDWQPDGDGCSVVLPTTGVHWLQVVGQPRFTAEDRWAQLSLHVPPLPGAVLDLKLPPKVGGLQVSGAVRTTTSKATAIPNVRNQWQYLIGGGHETLDIRWTSQGVKSSTGSWERLKQLSWLHVDPAAARLDVQLSLTGLQAPALLLELEVSPQLKLTPPDEDSPIIEVLTASPSDPTKLQLRLRPGLPDDVFIPLHFELQRTESVGHIFFPRVRLQGSPPVQRLFAVSVAAGLSYDENVSLNVRNIEPAEFFSSWAAADEEPLYSYALGQEDPEWSLRVWPDPQAFEAQQSLRVHCLPNEARVDFEAAIDGLTGSWLSHHLQVPASLQIDSIQVQIQSEVHSIPVRWSRSRVHETDVTVFLGRPLQQPHRLLLTGHVDATAGNEVAFPKVQLIHGGRSEIHMDLYRTEDVKVSWSDAERIPAEIHRQIAPVSREEIHIGSFSWRSSEARKLSRLRFERNQQEFETASVTTVDLGADGWTACLNSRFLIRQGVVSHVSLTVPNNFRPPYELLPKQVGIIAEGVRETPSGKELTLLLAQPVAAGEQIDVRLSGILSLPADRHLVVPSLQWKSAIRRDRFVLLPNSIDGELVYWKTSGLRRQAIPKAFDTYASKWKDAYPLHSEYHIEQNQFEAVESSYGGAMQNALVRSAMVSGIIDKAGLLTATAELVLQPGRATACQILLPPHSQLRQLIVGDLPVRREYLEDGSWRVPLGPPFMPQRIVVNYRSQPERTGQRLRLAPPQILLGDQALPTPRTWWSIRATNDLQIGKPSIGQKADQVRIAKETYRRALTVLNEASSQASELPRKEGLAWLQTWQDVIRKAKLDWQACDLSNQDLVGLTELEKASQDFVNSFATDDPNFIARETPLTYLPRLPLNPELSLAGQELFFVSDSKGELELTVAPGSKTQLWRWIVATMLLCGVSAVVLRLKNNSQWHHKICHWPHTFAMGSGLLGWLLLKPSAVGMLVIALTMTSLAINQWRRFRYYQRRESDTQLAVPTS